MFCRENIIKISNEIKQEDELKLKQEELKKYCLSKDFVKYPQGAGFVKRITNPLDKNVFNQLRIWVTLGWENRKYVIKYGWSTVYGYKTNLGYNTSGDSSSTNRTTKIESFDEAKTFIDKWLKHSTLN